MYCPKCGKPVDDMAFFCQWCGNKLDLFNTHAIVEKIRMLRQSHELEVAGLIASIYKSEAYKKQYDSFEDFGRDQLDMDKSLMFKYKDVGSKFVGEHGEMLIPDAEQWGLGKLTVLLGLEFDEIAFLREHGYIDPSMKMQDLREAVNLFKEAKKQI